MKQTLNTILEMPLAYFLGIRPCDTKNGLLEIAFREELVNHIHSYHASVIYTLAEISSGYFLAASCPEESLTTIPLVRRSTTKYVSIPKNDLLYSRVRLNNQRVEDIKELLKKLGKITIGIHVDILDVTDKLIFTADIEWIVRYKPEYLKVSKTESNIHK